MQPQNLQSVLLDTNFDKVISSKEIKTPQVGRKEQSNGNENDE